jgi:hypothetical protein
MADASRRYLLALTTMNCDFDAMDARRRRLGLKYFAF